MQTDNLVVFQGEMLVTGEAVGEVISTKEMFSFWGGFSPDTGVVVDQHHQLANQSLAGKVLVVPRGKGSSTGSPVLVDAIMSGNGPVAIVLKEVDEIMALGGVVCKEFFNTTIPIIVLKDEYFSKALTAKKATIHADGQIEFQL